MLPTLELYRCDDCGQVYAPETKIKGREVDNPEQVTNLPDECSGCGHDSSTELQTPTMKQIKDQQRRFK